MIYIPSKARASTSLTAELLQSAGICFFLVVEPNEQEEYKWKFPGRVLVLPEGDRGIAYARTWIKRYSRGQGEQWHWQLDDNIQWLGSRIEGHNVRLDPKDLVTQVFEHVELVAKSYKQIGICGLTYAGWAFNKKTDLSFNVNCFSALYINNEPEIFWRPDVVDDVDYALQLLFTDWNTIQFNRLLMEKKNTLTGGITDAYVARDEQLRRLKIHLETRPGAFKIKKCYRMERFETFHLRPSRIWSQFRNRPPRLRDDLELLSEEETSRTVNLFSPEAEEPKT